MSAAGVQVTAWCAACAGERRPQRTRLGELRRRDGWVSWVAFDKAWQRRLRKLGGDAGSDAGRVRDAVVLALPGEPRDRLPATVNGFCARHGEGTVELAQLLGATGDVYVALGAATGPPGRLWRNGAAVADPTGEGSAS